MSKIKAELNKENASDYLEGYKEGCDGLRCTYNSAAYEAGHEAGYLKMRKDNYGNHVPSGGVIG